VPTKLRASSRFGGRGFEAEKDFVLVGDGWGAEQLAVVCEGDEFCIEERVEMRGEQEAVEDIQPFVVGFAVRPGFRVARAQECGNGESSERAGSAPVFE